MTRKKPLNRKTVFFHLDPDTKYSIIDRSEGVLWMVATVARCLLTKTLSDLEVRAQLTKRSI